MFSLRDVGAVKRRNEMINKLKPAPKITLKKSYIIRNIDLCPSLG